MGIAWVCCCLFFAQAEKPDVVVLKNGDTISGTLVGSAEGVLIVTTEYAKEIKISLAHVRSITTSKSVNVLLADGELLKGRLAAGQEGQVVVQSDEAGPTKSIELARVTAFNPPEKKPAKYQGSIGLAASLASGNTDRISVALAAEASRRSENDRFSLRFLWNYAEEKDATTSRNVFAGLKYDYYFSPAWYGYLGAEFYRDSFKDLNLRSVGSAGLGWQAIEKSDLSLSLEAGLAYINENFFTIEDTDTLALRLAGRVSWTFCPGVTFTDLLTVYPKFDGGFLLRNEAGLTTTLGGGWALKFSNILDYTSDPPPATEDLDLLWLLGITYTFG